MDPTSIEHRRDVELESYFMGFTPNVPFKRQPGRFDRAEGKYLFGSNRVQVFFLNDPLTRGALLASDR